MLVLFETPGGYALFKLLDEKKLQESENLYKDFETPDRASKVVKLKQFEKFEDTTEALAAATALVEGKMSKSLKKVLKKVIAKDAQEQLLVADAKLGNAIKNKFNFSIMAGSAVQELMRCIRSQINSLIGTIAEKDYSAMSLGLAHSLSRYKLKFSPDKIDTMIIQSISLLDDMDKELNNYSMRLREWYGWHFPELSTFVEDNIVYAKTVKFMGTKEKSRSLDFSEILPDEVEAKLKMYSEVSTGAEISEEDMLNIFYLCDQIISLSTYRNQMAEYLKMRMMAIAPNLTILVGELVGARLVAHAGSLVNLAKYPASTVQILGAEKALFRALKTRKDTPKYGLIYHAALVGQSSAKLKGKISRMLAAKASLASRMDAFSDESSTALGIEHKAYLELRLKHLEEGSQRKISGTGKMRAKYDKYSNQSQVLQYSAAADSTLPSSTKRKRESGFDESSKPKRIKQEEVDWQAGGDVGPSEETPPIKKKKKKIKQEVEEEGGDFEQGPSEETPPAKKKIKQEVEEEGGDFEQDTEETPKKKKKKKRQEKAEESFVEEEEPSGKKHKTKKVKAEPVEETSFAQEEEEESVPQKKKKKKKPKE